MLAEFSSASSDISQARVSFVIWLATIASSLTVMSPRQTSPYCKKEPQTEPTSCGSLLPPWGALEIVPDGRRMSAIADSVSVGATKCKFQQ